MRFKLVTGVLAAVLLCGCDTKTSLRFTRVDEGQVLLEKGGRQAVLKDAGLRLVLVRGAARRSPEQVVGDWPVKLRVVNEGTKPVHFERSSILLKAYSDTMSADGPEAKGFRGWVWPRASRGQGPEELAPGKARTLRFTVPGSFTGSTCVFVVDCWIESSRAEAKILLVPDPRTKRWVPMELFPSYVAPYGPAPSRLSSEPQEPAAAPANQAGGGSEGETAPAEKSGE
jgi:hypothetical protein